MSAFHPFLSQGAAASDSAIALTSSLVLNDASDDSPRSNSDRIITSAGEYGHDLVLWWDMIQELSNIREHCRNPRFFLEFTSRRLFIALSKSDVEGAGRIPAVWKNLVAGTPTLKEYLAIGTGQEDHPLPVKKLV